MCPLPLTSIGVLHVWKQKLAFYSRSIKALWEWAECLPERFLSLHLIKWPRYLGEKIFSLFSHPILFSHITETAHCLYHCRYTGQPGERFITFWYSSVQRGLAAVPFHLCASGEQRKWTQILNISKYSIKRVSKDILCPVFSSFLSPSPSSLLIQSSFSHINAQDWTCCNTFQNCVPYTLIISTYYGFKKKFLQANWQKQCTTFKWTILDLGKTF